MNRMEATSLFESLGATVQGHVTKDTDVLIVGTNRGENKYNDALKYGTMIIPWPMFKTLGLAEEGGESFLEREVRGLTTELILLMTRTVDLIYAYSIHNPERGLLSFQRGAAAIERLLLAAWGTKSEGDRGDEPADYETNAKLVSRYLRECLSFWIGMIDSFNRGVENEEASDAVPATDLSDPDRTSS